MKKFLRCHVLPVICALSILISLCALPASAAWDPDDYVDVDSVAQIQSLMSIPSGWDINVVGVLLNKIGLDMTASFQDVAWNLIDTVVNGSGTGEISLPQLEAMASIYTSYFNRSPAENFVLQIVSGSKSVLTDALSYVVFGKTNFTFVVRSWGTSGYKRIYCPELDIFVTSSTGRYAYANEAHLETSGGAKWVPLSTMADKNTKYHQLSELQLRNTASELGYKPIKYAGYWIIKKNNASGTTDLVYADPEGRPYVAPYNANEWATSTNRPTTSVKDENGYTVEVPENSSMNIDLSGMTVTLPDGTFNFIDQLLYDESTKTYYIDSHDTYTVENNYYITNNYSWTYHINYTSITYIGQTAEYDKYYEVYYELPDGRDSADLTKEEVEQLNVSVDVIPYERGADDTSLRSLYHFDGDTKDSSYWNYCTDFTWNKGASLTYMDAGVFNGALYLDETLHDFTFTLPSYIASDDFTVQFRYYQSYTAAPQTDSYMYIGTVPVLSFDGAYLKSGDGLVLFTKMPIGTWNEIAVIRDAGTIYFYLNGVKFASSLTTTSSTVNGDTIRFRFGDSQQTYKYFDELRVLNYAIQTGGEYYEPTTVPHDTNLSLILPGASTPVADEYWSITSSKDNMLSEYGLDYWDRSFDGGNYFRQSSLPSYTVDTSYGILPSYISSYEAFLTSVPAGNATHWNKFPYFSYYPSTQFSFGSATYLSYSEYSFSLIDQSFTLGNPTTTMVSLCDPYDSFGDYCNRGFYYNIPTSGLSSLLLSFGTTRDASNGQWLHRSMDYSGVEEGKQYLFSIVFDDGTVQSVPFDFIWDRPDSFSSWYYWKDSSLVQYAGYEFGVRALNSCVINGSNTGPAVAQYYLVVEPIAGEEQTAGIVYMELIEGTETDLAAEKVTQIIGLTQEQFNTPTLAVRTDLDITSYQIGGVRPSLPTKGQVWALVENERITSIQIYNGSAWEGVDGRIWTGERWIPARSYNIITLQDMYDIADATQDFEYIYSEAGFWTWWQKSWNVFTEKLFSVLGSGGSGGTSITPSSVKDGLSQALSSLIESIFRLITEVLKSLIGAAMDLISGMFGFLSETVLGGISDFFDALEELANPFESTVTDEDGSSSTVIALPDDISTVFAFFSGLFMILPEQLRAILFFGIGFMLVLAVFKLIRT